MENDPYAPFGADPQQPADAPPALATPSAQQAPPPPPGYGPQQPCGAPQGGGPYAPPFSQPAWAAAPPPPSVLSMAWADVRASKGWFGRAALLTLVMMVPVLNFFAYGYLLMWGCDAARGERGPLPRGVFRDGAFSRGFFMMAAAVIVGAAVGLVAAIPFVGLLVFVALVFLYPFMYAAYLRMGLTERFGSLFELSEIGRAFRAGMGQAMLSWWVPMPLAAAAATVVSIPFMLLAMMPLAIAVGGVWPYPAEAALVALVCMVACLLMLAYVALFACTCAMMTSMRAFGHWVARFAPHWAAPAAGFEEEGWR